MLNGEITHSFEENTCHLVIRGPHAKHKPSEEEHQLQPGTDEPTAHVDRIRNCDIFIDSHDLYFYADVKLFKFHSRRTFDLKELKTLHINYDTQENCYQIGLRILPSSPTAGDGGAVSGDPAPCGGGGGATPKPKTVRKEYIGALQVPFLSDWSLGKLDKETVVQEWKFKRITDQCQLHLNGQIERAYKLTNQFGYGFASKYSGPLETSELDKSTCRIADPQRLSPFQRRLDRLVDEMKRFSREQYKMNFVELQVPSGHQNPLRYRAKIVETSMTQEQAHLLHNLSICQQKQEEESVYNRLQHNEIDCGLISIMLAICYDVRTTNNDPTCESGWTRCILCPLICYFEQFDNYRDVVVAFLRRVITYPLYRNFELGRQCVRDAIEVLKGGRNWLINQLLLTHQQFATSEPSRDTFNSLYIEDYIRYVSNTEICTDDHLRLLARNVKNVLMDVSKRHLGLGINEIETELIKELMQEMRLDANPSAQQQQQQLELQVPGADDLDADNDTSGQEDETTTDDDSVITDSFESMDMDMRLIENEMVYSVDDDDDDEDDDDEEDDEDDDDDDEDINGDDDDHSSSTSSSDAEGNSVIEQCSNSNSEAASSITK
ncbi:protein SHQ1 homolog [Drosophila tropicalis]|uniref:protein SHQ1 homolog n=1 Tax=Drosophila tropicalis TaxID=46794 RepID=UPI0035ABAE98